MTKQGQILANSKEQALDKNRFSKNDDNNAVLAMEIVKERLEKEKPHNKYTIEKRLYIKEVYNLDFNNPIIAELYKGRGGYISPDGGILYENGKPICAVEMKNQGSERTRTTRQQGNALERGHKNLKIMKDYFEKNGVYNKPYIIFCHGFDFEVYKSAWRIALSFVDYDINKINKVNTDEIDLYIQPEDYTIEQMVDIIYKEVSNGD